MSRRRLAVAVAATALAGAVFASGAEAAGPLDFDPDGAPSISDLSPITLTGTAQLASLTIEPFVLTDQTETGAGWHVLLTIGDLVNGASTIAAADMTMAAPVVAPVVGSSMTGVAAHATNGDLASGEKIVTAEVGAGMGGYAVSPLPVQLVVPFDALPGTYSGAASVTLVSGP